jgi:GTP cyclohydrolase FolE2
MLLGQRRKIMSRYGGAIEILNENASLFGKDLDPETKGIINMSRALLLLTQAVEEDLLQIKASLERIEKALLHLQ